MSRIWRAVCCLLLVGALHMGMGTGNGNSAQAQGAQTGTAMTSDLRADSLPYHLTWNGHEGTLSQDGVGADPARSAPLVFLLSDAGPKGYAKYLAWFLARDHDGFSLLWCYLNDSGQEFYCYLYRYPINQLTSLRFTGRYRFVAPDEPVAETPLRDFTATTAPHYAGPDFVYGNWTRRAGTLAQLNLHPVQTVSAASPVADRKALEPTATSGPTNRTLQHLSVAPLHEIHVAGGNGWRAGGWRELHALALDAANDPYYLILYSNSSRGYVIDLKRAQTYVADYVQPVLFSPTQSVFGQTEDQVTGPPELHVPRYSRHEIVLTATGTYTNPYDEVLLDVDFHGPGGRTITVPGFWDGGQTWRVRIAPTAVGDWTWRTRSTDPGLKGQEGMFTCITGPEESHGFLTTNPDYSYRHHFATVDGTPFLPVYAVFPIHHLVDTDPAMAVADEHYQRYVDTSDLNRIRSAGSNPHTTQAAQQLPAQLVAHSPSEVPKPITVAVAGTPGAAARDAYARFTAAVDNLAAQGFTRLIGEYLIDTAQFRNRTQRNEGGAPFIDYDPDRINPAYFQAMDRRVAYATEHGLVPDIGVGVLDADLFNLLTQTQFERLWRYAVARYAGYNVCWTLFGTPIGRPQPAGGDDLIADLADKTRRYDPAQHPLTTVLPGSIAPSPRPHKPDAPTTDGGTDGANQADTPGGNFIQSPGGLTLGPTPPVNVGPSIPALTLPFIPSWASTITFNGGSPAEVYASYTLNKPVALYDRSTPANPDSVRHRLWQTRMFGGYWAADFAPTAERADMDRPEVRWSAYCGKLFAHTRYWRLTPHSEMVGGLEESPFERRRRHLAELEAAHAAGLADNENGGSAAVGAPANATPAGPIYVLADPGQEYVVYFEKGGTVTLDLLEATGRVTLVWFNPRTGEFSPSDIVQGGAYRTFRAPDNNDWVLTLSRR